MRRFLATVPALADCEDGALTRLGMGPELAESFARLEARTRRSVWNLSVQARVSMNRMMRHLDESSRSRGVEERTVYTARTARNQPLLTSFEPGLRIGPVAATLIVLDESYAVVGGTDRAEHHGAAWGTDDPDLVALAGQAFLEVWDQSVSWQEAGLRPPLPERRFRVAVRLVDGYTDSEIAGELGISPRTVSVEVRAIVDWLGARSRTHAIAMLVGAA